MNKTKLINSILIVFIVFFFIWQRPPTREVLLKGGEKQVTKESKTPSLDRNIDTTTTKDEIPPIDHPQFTSISDAVKFMKNSSLGIAVEINAISRFYPLDILAWHEIVNDVVGGRRVLITYCPLCYTGIVFDPMVGKERVSFGISGKVWNSNLLMYDRKTGSLWSQILGKAVSGEMIGTKLKMIPSDVTSFGIWKTTHENGAVLSRDTGTEWGYEKDPYEAYYSTPRIFFPIDKKDDRLGDKDIVLGIVINGKARAYQYEIVKKHKRIEDTLAGYSILVIYNGVSDTVRFYLNEKNGKNQRMNYIRGFWFAWAAAHPDTELHYPNL